VKIAALGETEFALAGYGFEVIPAWRLLPRWAI